MPHHPCLGTGNERREEEGKRRGEGWGSGARNGAPEKCKWAEVEWVPFLTSFPGSLPGRRGPWGRDCSLFLTPRSTHTAFRSTNLFKQHFIDMYSFFLFCHLPGKKCEQGSHLAWLFGQNNEKHCKKVKALIPSGFKVKTIYSYWKP